MTIPQTDLKKMERSAEYFLNGGDLHILVGNVLFRVHSFFFERDSAKFRDILTTPVSPSQPRPGSTDSRPMVVMNCSPSDFSKFLWVFYNPKYSVYSATPAEWVAILKIAHEYEFLEVKNLAIRGLDTCDLTVVQRIRIYETYQADTMYLLPLYATMCMREDGPTDDETEEMGMKTSLMIFRARERLRSDGSKSPLPNGVDESEVFRMLYSFLGVNPAPSNTNTSNTGASSANTNGHRDPQDPNGKKNTKTNGTRNRSNSRTGGGGNGAGIE
ncbi:hypothetical protein NLJ89_g7486 [Agrocybe chaxingu]|uniref:BTB domain-containing protein n=1 Tax=Agrocybe chaxingu TaxID=84603 RepID=A0A9W8JWL0_9AGAR|nr:hypothetical protein NLJ89_g7486 [Agrocybe chaxingu]